MQHPQVRQRLNRRNLRRPTGPRHEGGFIVGLLLGVMVASIIAIVAYDQYSISSRKTRIETAVSQITTITASAQKVFGPDNQFGDVTTAIAVQANVVPASLRIAGTGTAQNTYDGAITFTPDSITAANDSLAMGYAHVRRADCYEIVGQVQRLYRRIVVGATTVKPNDGVLDVSALGTACDSSATSDLTFVFGRSQ